MRVRALSLALAALLGLGACARTDTEGLTVARVVGPEGARITSADGLFWLLVPPGALREAIELSITQRTDTLVTDLHSTLYEVAPEGLGFETPITAHYDASRTTAWVGRRALATFDTGTPETLPATTVPAYDRSTHFASGEVHTLLRRRFGLALLTEAGSCADVGCGTPCAGCDPAQPGCMADPDGPRCSVDGACTAPQASCPAEGWTTRPAAGVGFVVNDLRMAPPGAGLDLDGRCRAEGDCLDNVLGALGPEVDGTLRQGVVGGATTFLVEVVGADWGFGDATDGSLTLKWYDGQDFDSPSYPGNDYSVPLGETRCCEFFLDPGSVGGSPANALSRFPARMERGLVTSALDGGSGPRLDFPTWRLRGEDADSVDHRAIPLERARIAAHVGRDGAELEGGLIGGMVAARELARAADWTCVLMRSLCSGVEGSMLELVLGHAAPDLDGDGDGLESFERGVDGHIVRCVDGDGTVIPPVEAGRPASCAESPRVADGFSVSYTFQAVRATIHTGP